MQFALIGMNFQQADITVRDKVSFSDTKKLEMYGIMEDLGIPYGVVVSTCNRSEIYFSYEREEQIEELKNAYARFFHVEDYAHCIQALWGREAVIYLFEVCAGLRSLVVGEDQILGQMMESTDFAAEQGKCDKVLYKIFREAFTCAKRIHSELKISEHPLSIAYIGITQLIKSCGVEGKTVMVVGAGKMSSLAMRYLFEQHPAKVYNANRSMKNMARLKEEFADLVLVPFEDRYEKLPECDIIVSATACPHIIVKAEKTEERTKPLTCLDLASPRDIDPAFREREQVTLFDIDSLQEIASENLEKRKELAERSEQWISESVDEIEEWMKSIVMDPTIAGLQEKCDQIVQSTYGMLERKLDLTEREKHILRKTLHASMHRLIKEPIRTLKSLNEDQQEQYKEIVEHLFSMESN